MGTRFAEPLDEADVDRDPVRQFLAWFAQASTGGVREPEAAADGHRVVPGASLDQRSTHRLGRGVG